MATTYAGIFGFIRSGWSSVAVIARLTLKPSRSNLSSTPSFMNPSPKGPCAKLI